MLPKLITLPETNIAPKNGWLEYYFPIGEAYFQGRTVSFREGNYMLSEAQTCGVKMSYLDMIMANREGCE